MIPTLDIVIFGVYLAVVAAVGVLVSRKEKESDDYFLAGRNLTWWIIGGSMIAANISTHHFIGMSGRAYEIGLVNEVVPDGEHLQAALRMANELCSLAPLVLGAIKKIVNGNILPKGPAEIAAMMTRDMGVISTSDDFREGQQAFLEKRRPVFSGR